MSTDIIFPRILPFRTADCIDIKTNIVTGAQQEYINEGGHELERISIVIIDKLVDK